MSEPTKMWALKHPEGEFIFCEESEVEVWDRFAKRMRASHERTKKHFEAKGYRAVQVEVREVEG
jgi:hypothetical protein